MPNEDSITRDLAEIKQAFAELFVAMDQAQQADVGSASALNTEIADRMRRVDLRMRAFVSELGDWSESRTQVSQSLAGEVDRFLESLEHVLGAMKTRLTERMATIHEERTRLAESIRTLQKNRQGVRGYKTSAQSAKLFDSKA